MLPALKAIFFGLLFFWASKRKVTRRPAGRRNARCASGQLGAMSEATEKRPDHPQVIETPAAQAARSPTRPRQQKNDPITSKPSKRPLRKRPGRRHVRGNRKTTRSPASHRNARCAHGQIEIAPETEAQNKDKKQSHQMTPNARPYERSARLTLVLLCGYDSAVSTHHPGC